MKMEHLSSVSSFLVYIFHYKSLSPPWLGLFLGITDLGYCEQNCIPSSFFRKSVMVYRKATDFYDFISWHFAESVYQI